MTLNGKRVLITGGGTGLGADMAAHFAAVGADVVISGRGQDTLDTVARKNHGIRAICADVTREEDVRALFDTAGQVDIVIANAGASASGPFGRTSLQDWNAMLAVNLTGVFLTLREGLNQMTGWGRLISVASTAALKGYAYVAPYAAAKHGVVGLTRSLALEVAGREVTVNALCPGFLDTEMTQRSITTIMEKTGKTHTEAVASLTGHSPQKRLVKSREVSNTALWLCGIDSGGINGQAIAIAGGEV